MKNKELIKKLNALIEVIEEGKKKIYERKEEQERIYWVYSDIEDILEDLLEDVLESI